ncbi:hypothetical protein PQ455_02985 [Sphingomonas naphthae]|uniref:DUF86 domain-containing protein n=1 Tax=Sphingomonas naphthae TaxID=1813468 RepID=A0ABY7TMI9_9SPHN|nr:hypothetical protein [Sphingomonas naphthae]WCT74211.1 hypothetical protein PQ455_02985 [Sphingomonas naphthae]
MSPEEYQRAVVEAIGGCHQLVGQIEASRARLQALAPFTGETLTALDADEWDGVYAFQMKFLLLQDLASRRLLRGFLALSGEDPRNFSMRQAIERAAQLGGLASAEEWMDLLIVRNMLAHDYPVDLDAFADWLSQAWDRLDTLILNVKTLIAALKGLLP